MWGEVPLVKETGSELRAKARGSHREVKTLNP